MFSGENKRKIALCIFAILLQGEITAMQQNDTKKTSTIPWSYLATLGGMSLATYYGITQAKQNIIRKTEAYENPSPEAQEFLYKALKKQGVPDSDKIIFKVEPGSCPGKTLRGSSVIVFGTWEYYKLEQALKEKNSLKTKVLGVFKPQSESTSFNTICNEMAFAVGHEAQHVRNKDDITSYWIATPLMLQATTFGIASLANMYLPQNYKRYAQLFLPQSDNFSFGLSIVSTWLMTVALSPLQSRYFEQRADDGVNASPKVLRAGASSFRKDTCADLLHPHPLKRAKKLEERAHELEAKKNNTRNQAQKA